MSRDGALTASAPSPASYNRKIRDCELTETARLGSIICTTFLTKEDRRGRSPRILPMAQTSSDPPYPGQGARPPGSLGRRRTLGASEPGTDRNPGPREGKGVARSNGKPRCTGRPRCRGRSPRILPMAPTPAKAPVLPVPGAGVVPSGRASRAPTGTQVHGERPREGGSSKQWQS
jgi:hypothetical protein